MKFAIFAVAALAAIVVTTPEAKAAPSVGLIAAPLAALIATPAQASTGEAVMEQVQYRRRYYRRRYYNRRYRR